MVVSTKTSAKTSKTKAAPAPAVSVAPEPRIVASDAVITKPVDYIIMFDVRDSNPNGDPDNMNAPRVASDGTGYATGVSLKRKIRDAISLMQEGKEGFDISVVRGVGSDTFIAEECDKERKESGKTKKDKLNQTSVEAALCKRFYDIRAFGAVLSTPKIVENRLGRLTGPVQMDLIARSLDAVESVRDTITRVANPHEDKEENGAFGANNYINYGLYWISGSISPSFASGARQTATGFSESDQDLYFDAIRHMFRLNQASGRGLITLRKLFIFEHQSKFGRDRDEMLRCISVKRGDEPAVPLPAYVPGQATRRFEDYEITLGELPEDVKLISLAGDI